MNQQSKFMTDIWYKKDVILASKDIEVGPGDFKQDRLIRGAAYFFIYLIYSHANQSFYQNKTGTKYFILMMAFYLQLPT